MLKAMTHLSFRDGGALHFGLSLEGPTRSNFQIILEFVEAEAGSIHALDDYGCHTAWLVAVAGRASIGFH